MTAQAPLLAELDHAIAHGSPERCAKMLLHITDLFIRESVRFSDAEIGLFDDVIVRLATEIEVSVRSMLAHRLAPIANAPLNITRMLACDDEIRVAYPILAQSERLDEPTLVQAARTKSQEHLFAISQRQSLSEPITDVLVERGNEKVLLSTASNRGAKFSQAGFSHLVERSEGDDALTICVGSRPDIPRELFLALLATASEIARTKLIAEHPHAREDINHAVTIVAGRLCRDFDVSAANTGATQDLQQLQEGEPTDDRARAFAADEQLEATTVALAKICDVPVEVVEHAMLQDQSGQILILAKAAKLSWPAVKTLLALRDRRQGIASSHFEQSLASFERLSLTAARRIMEFYKMRQTRAPDNRWGWGEEKLSNLRAIARRKCQNYDA